MFSKKTTPSLAHNLQPVLLARIVVVLPQLLVREVLQVPLMFS